MKLIHVRPDINKKIMSYLYDMEKINITCNVGM